MINQAEWNRVCKEAARDHFRQAWVAWRARNKRFEDSQDKMPVGLAIRMWGGTEVAQTQPACPACGSLTGYVFSLLPSGMPTHQLTADGHCFQCGYRGGYTEFLGNQADPERWGAYPVEGGEDPNLLRDTLDYSEGVIGERIT